jgi:hypothetical protein
MMKSWYPATLCSDGPRGQAFGEVIQYQTVNPLAPQETNVRRTHVTRERIDSTDLADDPEVSEIDFDGVEQEVEEPEDFEHLIKEPFDPTKIRIRTWSPTIDLLMTRVRENEIDLMPEFQRSSGIWSNGAQSRLIESILIRIPLPAFYMDATDEEHLIVVDGLQRLTTLRRFVIDEKLRLRGLEFLDDFTGKKFSELPRQFQRRIQETQVTVYLIEKGTPDEVKYNIFKRINTGGLPLSPQEIRHALNPGPVVRFLKSLAESDEFQRATAGGVSGKRMVDRECVLRFAAFAITSYVDYNTRDFDHFLHGKMAELNAMSEDERESLGRRFRRSMVAAHGIFGDDAFRKLRSVANVRPPVNKALYEAWAVNLDACTDKELNSLVEKKIYVLNAFMSLLRNDQEFETAITFGTADPPKVKTRFLKIRELLKGVLK